MIPADEKNIVILETNPARRDYLRSMLSQLEYNPISFDKETICLDNLSLLKPRLVILGSLSPDKTFRFVNTLKLRNFGFNILIISNDPEIQNFININEFIDVLVIKTLNKPSEIKKALNRYKKNRLKSEMFRKYPLIIGNSPEMVKVKKMISELSRSKDTVLIQGETGTGKDLVARAIHYKSDRRENPFIKVNTGTLSCEDLDCKLFGYSTENFHDFHQNKKGIFEAGNTGTVFLDSIENMPASFQPRLLQVLEGGGVAQNDSEKKLTFDVRIIAATSADLDRFVIKKEFRKDLFYRLNVVRIEIPPLRNRIKDIFLLADFFNDKFCGDLNRSHCDLPKKIKDIFGSYQWPENVRELKNIIKSYLFHSNEHTLTNQLFQGKKNELTDFINYYEDIYSLARLSDIKKKLKDLNKVSLKNICIEVVVRIEKKLIKKALEKTKWNRKEAANLLNISYKSLLNKIRAYDLT